MSFDAIRVQKYGGSSVASTSRILKIAEMVAQRHQQGERLVIVVSAMGKTTNDLVSLAHEVSTAPSPREFDFLVSTGERISAGLFAMALKQLGVDSVALTGGQAGILTDETFTEARIEAVRCRRVLDELEKDRVVVVTGFQGENAEGEVTTIGRGGSDTTAVALAAKLGQRCEIYSDVDGVYSADPRVVPGAVHLPALDYESMLTLSRCGAKVLYQGAVELAKQNSVEIVARATFKPGRETVVDRNGGAATAVTALAPIRTVTLAQGLDATTDVIAHAKGEDGQVQAIVRETGQSEWASVTLLADSIGHRRKCLSRLSQYLADTGIAAGNYFNCGDHAVTWSVPANLCHDAVRVTHSQFVEAMHG